MDYSPTDEKFWEKVDGLSYYHLEDYLFNVVYERFHSQGWLSAFDFFSIIIWKANRAKSKVARKLMAHEDGISDLDAIVRSLTNSIYKAAENKERMRILIGDWQFALPMASAILTVLYPEEFTVYDYKVCNQIAFPELKNYSSFSEGLWADYNSYCAKVMAESPQNLSLRDKDRYLWGKYTLEKLKEDIKQWQDRAVVELEL
jgi:hypothetical protein